MFECGCSRCEDTSELGSNLRDLNHKRFNTGDALYSLSYGTPPPFHNQPRKTVKISTFFWKICKKKLFPKIPEDTSELGSNLRDLNHKRFNTGDALYSLSYGTPPPFHNQPRKTVNMSTFFRKICKKKQFPKIRELKKEGWPAPIGFSDPKLWLYNVI